MISRETIEQVLLRNDAETVIGSYVTLRRAGSNLKGLCPFHSEKTPSFTVYPADNSFYCFGCGVGGNVITFIQKKENLDYRDAIEFLADRAGITIVREERGVGYEQKPRFERSRMFEMNRDAAIYFSQRLFDNTPEARAALEYFTVKRGLSLGVIKHFGLGFAPNSFDMFSGYMRSKGYSYEELVAGFLCGKSERGTYYDAFRNRVMFPIIDVSGNVIAFGGRVMDDSKPKYKNSSDTPVFKKSRNLFALNFARHTCKESLILCEGYMDVIAMHSAGFTNAVATLGTAITPEQARMISRYTKKVILSYDADEAGQKAAQRAIGLLNEVDVEVAILRIPGAKDPDEYIKINGKDKFAELLKNTKTRFEHNSETILAKYDLEIPQDKIKALHELEKLISETYSSAERDIYIRIVAKKLDVDPKSVKLDVDGIISKNLKARKKEESNKIKQDAIGYSDKVNPDFMKAPAAAKNEETVIGLLYVFPEHRKHVFESDILTEDDFVTELDRRFFKYFKEQYQNGGDDLSCIGEAFTADEFGRLVKMKLKRMELTDNGTAVLEEAISSLKKSVSKKTNQKTNTFEGLYAVLRDKRKTET